MTSNQRPRRFVESLGRLASGAQLAQGRLPLWRTASALEGVVLYRRGWKAGSGPDEEAALDTLFGT